MAGKKGWLLAGVAVVMAAMGTFAYYSIEKEIAHNGPSNAKVRKFVRQLKRQVMSFCVYFVKDTRENLKQEVSQDMIQLMSDQFSKVLSKIYQNKLTVLLSKKSMTMEELNYCLEGRDRQDPDIIRDMAEINQIINRAIRLQFPRLEIPEVYANVPKQCVYDIQKEILVSSTKKLCPLLTTMKKNGKLDYLEFIKAMDSLDLEQMKISILKKHGWPDEERDRMVEYFNKLDEQLRISDGEFSKLMGTVEKVYERIVEQGMKEDCMLQMDQDWIQEQYKDV